MRVRLDKIKIGKRIRKDMGDLSELRQSMSRYGIINPITLSQRFELLAGYRRYRAARELGWEEIECNIINIRSKREGFEIEVGENIVRKDFTPEEIERINKKRDELYATGLKKLWYGIKSFMRSVLVKLGLKRDQQ